MSIALVYWVLMLFWFVFGLWGSWPVTAANAKPAVGNLLLFILLLLIGWKIFGPPVHG
jgi:hypothetical protein